MLSSRRESVLCPLTIQLISRDLDLYAICRDILAEIPESSRSCVLTATSPDNVPHDADLHIWDFDPNIPLPDSVAWNPLRHIFLVDRKDLLAFQESTTAGNILLKPVTRAMLATFLAPLVSYGAVRSLRADRDEILQCLIQTNLKLQEYDHDRTTFLARAVHDFRAPLTALRGYCGLLRGGGLGQLNDNQKEVLRRMENSANRLSRMSAAMFELSIGRRVKRTPELRPGDIQECVDQALHEILPFADEKSISISSDLQPVDALHFEAGQIEELLLNILDNACKFTPKGGSIEIRGYPFFWERRNGHSAAAFPADRRRGLIQEPNSYRIDIVDSGEPIPAQHLHRIFEEYTSYSGGHDRSGGGLGLAICRMIAAQHGGRIWAQNSHSGPVFSFVLPLRRFRSEFTETGIHLTENNNHHLGATVHAEA